MCELLCCLAVVLLDCCRFVVLWICGYLCRCLLGLFIMVVSWCCSCLWCLCAGLLLCGLRRWFLCCVVWTYRICMARVLLETCWCCLIAVCYSACFGCLALGCSCDCGVILCVCLRGDALCLTLIVWVVGCLLIFCIALWFVSLLFKAHC